MGGGGGSLNISCLVHLIWPCAPLSGAKNDGCFCDTEGLLLLLDAFLMQEISVNDMHVLNDCFIFNTCESSTTIQQKPTNLNVTSKRNFDISFP